MDIIDFNGEEFITVIPRDERLVVFFTSPSDFRSRNFERDFVDYAGEYAGRAVFGRFDIDMYNFHAAAIGVRSAPTVVAFRRGHRLLEIVDIRPPKFREMMEILLKS